MGASVDVRAYPGASIAGKVLFVYPTLRADTRTGRVCIEVPNADGRLKAEMYADITFRSGADGSPVVAVPDSAVLDSGTHQIVLVASGEGRFDPREVKLGARGNGYSEVLEGVAEGETIATAAIFLIDSESNLNAALAGLARPGEGAAQ
jgi:Cu(I)/Ag(I) efflux system membrane fusion protein